jgi:hypothetical protein
MAVANTLAYYVTGKITAVKSFIVQAQGHATVGHKAVHASNGG